jgi:hypothetical protein
MRALFSSVDMPLLLSLKNPQRMIVTGIPMTYRHYVPHSFCTSENASSRTDTRAWFVTLIGRVGPCPIHEVLDRPSRND